MKITVTVTVPDGIYCRGCKFIIKKPFKNPACILFENVTLQKQPAYRGDIRCALKCKKCLDAAKQKELINKMFGLPPDFEITETCYDEFKY
jgi:hypothetical protein